MAHQVAWTKVIVERFIESACLSKLEEATLRMRATGYTNSEIAEALNISLSTVNRLIALLKRKYDNVQKYDALLPPRKFSAQELYQDEH